MGHMKKLILLLFLYIFSTVTRFTQTWIRFPGDYEYWLGNQMNNRRTERGIDVLVQWKLDNQKPMLE